jgi:lipopolysaccharide transport system ATP-binding protein
MSEIAIRAAGLGKRYRIPRVQRRHNTLRDALADGARRTAAGLLSLGRGEREVGYDEFWALRDVSFELRRGEVLGVIGANGAGKSTLLKLLSRITEPTVGEADIHGRVGSLLEVGTGFHSELTGRENIYLSGAILGMRRAEITRRFDEIVAFAEIGPFVDTPVKHYSSGMYLRLAFAVAAHLEPEVLIVDEVLAVGDAAFQKKCLGKMGDIAGQGRTVLFVSHDMDAVQRLCTRCMLLEGGGVAAEGAPGPIVRTYLGSEARQARPGEWIDVSRLPRRGSGEVRFTRVRYSGGPGGDAYPCGPVEFELEVVSDAARTVRSAAVDIRAGDLLLINAEIARSGEAIRLDAGRNVVRFSIEALYLNPGEYDVDLWIGELSGEGYDHVEAALRIPVVAASRRGFGTSTKVEAAVPCAFSVLVDTHAPAATPSI